MVLTELELGVMVIKHIERLRANRKNGAWPDEDVVASLGRHMAMIVKLIHETVTHGHTDVFTHRSPQPLWGVHGLKAARCSVQLLSLTFMSKKNAGEKTEKNHQQQNYFCRVIHKLILL